MLQARSLIIPELDDPLFELNLISFYDSIKKTEAVEAKHGTEFFFAKDGSMLPEWYDSKTPSRIKKSDVPEPDFNGDFFIISHHGEPKVILEIENVHASNIQSLLDEYLRTTDSYFGDSDFIWYLQSRNIRVRSHRFDEPTAGGR